MNDQEKRNQHNRSVLSGLKNSKKKNLGKSNDLSIDKPRHDLLLKDGKIIQSGIVKQEDFSNSSKPNVKIRY